MASALLSLAPTLNPCVYMLYFFEMKSHYMAQADLNLTILPSPPPESCDYQAYTTMPGLSKEWYKVGRMFTWSFNFEK